MISLKVVNSFTLYDDDEIELCVEAFKGGWYFVVTRNGETVFKSDPMSFGQRVKVGNVLPKLSNCG